MKKILLIMFTLCFAVSACLFGITENKNVYAEEPETTEIETTDGHGRYHKDGFIYYIKDGMAVLTGIENKQDVVNIPEIINNYPVVKLYIGGFVEAKIINIPKTVNDIYDIQFEARGEYLRSKQYRMETINVNKANEYYTSIDGVLYDKKVSDVLIYPKRRKAKKYVEPSSVIDGSVFATRNYSYCIYLEEITFSSNKNNHSIAHMPYCENLKTINIPANVTSTFSGDYEEGPFYKCNNLTNVNIAKNSNLKYIGRYTFFGCKKIKSISLPKGVEEIANSAFDGCESLEKVTLQKGLKIIRYSAFSDCKNLKSITIPKGVTLIQDGAFEKCSKLKKIKLPKGLKVLGGRAFKRCKQLKSIKLPKGLKKIRGNTFHYCKKLKKITIPSTVKKISSYAFAGTGFTKFKIPKNIKSIGKSAFEDCKKLKSVKLPKKLKTIKECTFYGCKKLKKITIPKGVKTIESLSFVETKIKKVTIPKNVKKLYRMAFNEKCKIKREK